VVNDSGQKRKPGFRTAVEDGKALATVLAMEAESIFGRRTALVLGVLVLFGVLLTVGHSNDIKLWNLLEVLAVPITVGAAVPSLNWLQKKREQEVENQRAQDEALQAYLNQMSQLLIDKSQLLIGKERPRHRVVQGDELSTVARAWTVTVLDTLDDSRRKRRVVKFLYEAKLIYADRAIVRLSKVNLRGANLSEADLSGAALSGADLSEADLSGADLSGANLSYVSKANLRGTDLRGANLSRTDLSGANLSYAHLEGARGISEQQLYEQCKFLEGATMPNGQKYEDWLESKGSGKDRENSGPS
jgi:uncharacterized protein YjbI with pentapeptide repeats